jgi:hypothetical protein
MAQEGMPVIDSAVSRLFFLPIASSHFWELEIERRKRGEPEKKAITTPR